MRPKASWIAAFDGASGRSGAGASIVAGDAKPPDGDEMPEGSERVHAPVKLVRRDRRNPVASIDQDRGLIGHSTGIGPPNRSLSHAARQ